MRLADQIRHPIWTIVLILACFGLIAAFAGGTAAWLAQGGLAVLVQGVLAAAYLIGLARLIRWVRVTTDPEETDALYSSHPLARPVLRAGALIAAAIVTLAVFG